MESNNKITPNNSMDYKSSPNSNGLEKFMNIMSSENTSSGTIPKNQITSSSEVVSIKKIEDILEKLKKIVYPNNDEIPLIKIRDENSFESGEEIAHYIDTLTNYDDDKFSKCKICQNSDNVYFCEVCNKNLCDDCYFECKTRFIDHNLIDLSEEINRISKFKNNIREILDKLFPLSEQKINNNNEIIKKTKNYNSLNEYEMNSEIEKPIENDLLLIKAIIDKDYKNYFHYKNIEDCYNYLQKKIANNPISENLNNQNDLETEKNEMDIEEDSEDDNNYIAIKYKIKNEKQKKIRIFGKYFSNRYNNKCYIMYGNNTYELTEYFDLSTIKVNDNLEIKLFGINKIENASYMFSECSSLQDISQWNTNNVTNFGWMFYNCSSLEFLPDISQWNINNVSDISHMFDGCSSLKLLPDISKWNTKNVKNMNCIFYNCSSLKSLPDISQWNTSNVKKMSGIFLKCSSLESLPDISKWNTSNVTEMISIFRECSSLKSLPDISLWNTSKVNDMVGIFCDCSSLESLQDISKWNISKVKETRQSFENCSKLKSLPDISNWNTSNVQNMKWMFKNCSSLNTLPDISKWNTSNVKNMTEMFYNCSALNSFPDLKKWNLNNVTEKNGMFDGCPYKLEL